MAPPLAGQPDHAGRTRLRPEAFSFLVDKRGVWAGARHFWCMQADIGPDALRERMMLLCLADDEARRVLRQLDPESMSKRGDGGEGCGPYPMAISSLPSQFERRSSSPPQLRAQDMPSRAAQLAEAAMFIEPCDCRAGDRGDRIKKPYRRYRGLNLAAGERWRGCLRGGRPPERGHPTLDR